jgi:hypothetical protein
MILLAFGGVALRGATELLTTARPIVICEINNCKRYFERLSDLTEFMASLGYKLWRLESGRLRPAPQSPRDRTELGCSADNNYCFVPVGKPLALIEDDAIGVPPGA